MAGNFYANLADIHPLPTLDNDTADPVEVYIQRSGESLFTPSEFERAYQQVAQEETAKSLQALYPPTQTYSVKLIGPEEGFETHQEADSFRAELPPLGYFMPWGDYPLYIDSTRDRRAYDRWMEERIYKKSRARKQTFFQWRKARNRGLLSDSDSDTEPDECPGAPRKIARKRGSDM